MMKKKLLCMLLSVAMVFTAMDIPASASEVQTADEKIDAAADEEHIPEQTETAESIPDVTESDDSPESSSEQTETASDSDVSDQSESETASSEEAQPTETQTTDDSALESDESDETLSETASDLESETEPEEPTDTKLQVSYRTADEIQEFIEQEKAARTDMTTYKAEPAPEAPYSAGALSDATLDSASAMVRQIRFIAGLSYNISVNDTYNRLSQSAALLNYVNNTLTSSRKACQMHFTNRAARALPTPAPPTQTTRRRR